MWDPFFDRKYCLCISTSTLTKVLSALLDHDSRCENPDVFRKIIFRKTSNNSTSLHFIEGEERKNGHRQGEAGREHESQKEKSTDPQSTIALCKSMDSVKVSRLLAFFFVVEHVTRQFIGVATTEMSIVLGRIREHEITHSIRTLIAQFQHHDGLSA